jgi:hypothetical protein
MPSDFKYPPVKHRIPPLFQEIIGVDHQTELFDKFKVVSFHRRKRLKQRRFDLRQAAAKFIQEQKKP